MSNIVILAGIGFYGPWFYGSDYLIEEEVTLEVTAVLQGSQTSILFKGISYFINEDDVVHTVTY